jgi:hopanoid biosynthesis associated protein HpnK
MQWRPVQPSLSACFPTPEVDGQTTQSSLKSFPSADFDADVKRIRLIVNADDFGASEEVNEAVIRAFQQGVLTSCSLMVTGEAFNHAVRLAKENPGLAVGIHLVTVMGRAVLPKPLIPSLVDAEGRFSNDPVASGLRYFFSRSARRQLKQELAAQFERFKNSGLQLSHIDGHLHMHIHPVVFDLAVELGEQHGVRRMRVPEDDLALALRFRRYPSIGNRVHDWVFSLRIRSMKRRLKEKNFIFTERVYGHFQSGRMNAEYFHCALEHLQARTNEIYFHPAYYDATQSLSAERLQGLIEFKALTDKRIVDLLRHSQIELINYFQLDAGR